MSYRRRRGLRSRGTGSDSGARGNASATKRPAGAGDGRETRGPFGLPFRPGRWTATAVLTLAAVVVGYTMAARWLFPAPTAPGGETLVELPDLVGLDDASARERVADLGLRYEATAEVHHPRAEPGIVLSQSPLPGQLARPGAPVRVTLSRGPERQRVPDVNGLSERQARIILEQLGFTTVVRTEDAQIRSGLVLETSPAGGTELSIPAEVEIVVSGGFDVVAVPDLLGRHAEDVEELLAELGLVLGVVTFDEDAIDAPGRVIGQTPPAGYNLRVGGRVAIQVAGQPFRIERRQVP